jgi:hypothetical protein
MVIASKDSLIQDVKQLILEGTIVNKEDVSKYYTLEEIAVMSDFLVSVFKEIGPSTQPSFPQD